MAVVDDIKAELTEALEEIEATTGSVNFLYSAVNYVCTPGVEDYRKELEEQGYLEEYDLTLIVRQSVWTPGKGAIREKGTYNGTSYRIVGIADHPIGHSFVLMLRREK